MLPDFPAVKNHGRAIFIRTVMHYIPIHEPLLKGIHHSRVHEGRTATLTRADQSQDRIEFQKGSAQLAVPNEQMQSITLEQLMSHASDMARQLAGQQVQMTFERVSQAAENVGNVVSAKELGAKEAFLEMQRRMHMDFDPESLEPKDLMLVLHPDQIESFKKQAAEWEQDPDFQAELKRIREAKIEEWRARENRRKLVD